MLIEEITVLGALKPCIGTILIDREKERILIDSIIVKNTVKYYALSAEDNGSEGQLSFDGKSFFNDIRMLLLNIFENDYTWIYSCNSTKLAYNLLWEKGKVPIIENRVKKYFKNKDLHNKHIDFQIDMIFTEKTIEDVL